MGGDLAGFLSGAPVVGFSGSRVSGGPLCVAALGACAAVPPGVPVSVGCASGVDAVVRGAFPRAVVFSVSSGRFGSGRGAFARRSAALVRSLLPGGVLVVLPLVLIGANLAWAIIEGIAILAGRSSQSKPGPSP